MQKVAEFVRNCELIKGRKPAPEGTVSKNGKMVKRGGKWVPRAKGRSPAKAKPKSEASSSDQKTLTSAVNFIKGQLEESSLKAIKFQQRGSSVKITIAGRSATVRAAGKDEMSVRKDIIASLQGLVKGSQRQEKSGPVLSDNPNWAKVHPDAVEAAEWAMTQIKKRGLDVAIEPESSGKLKIKSGNKTRTVATGGLMIDVSHYKREINLAVTSLLNPKRKSSAKTR